MSSLDTSVRASLDASAQATSRSPRRRLSRHVAADVVAVGDFLSIMLGGMLPALIYAFAGDVDIQQVVIVQSTMIAGLIGAVCLKLRGMYDTSRMQDFPFQPSELFIAVFCAITAVLGLGFPTVLNFTHLMTWYGAWLSTSFTLILLTRLVARSAISQLAVQGRFNERVAIFGAGTIARRVHDLMEDKSLGINFTGVFDDRMGQDRLNPEGLTVVGRLDDLVESARKGHLDRVVIALPQSADTRLAQVVEKLSTLPVSTHIVTHIASDLIDTGVSGQLSVSALGPVGLLDVKKKH